MRDNEARETIAWVEQKVDRLNALLYGRTVDSEGGSVFARIAELERKVGDYNLEDAFFKIGERISKRESVQNPREKDCPVCGHLVLMKPKHVVTKRGSGSIGGMKYVDEWATPAFYCYGCGKTFKVSEGLVEA